MDMTLSSLQVAAPFAWPLTPAPVQQARGSEPPAAMSSNVLISVLDHLDYGLMIVTDTARVRFANRVALRECTSSKHAMRLADGHLHARQDREQQSLMRALAAAHGGRRSLVTFASQDPLLSAAIVPVHEWALPAGEPAALVVFSRSRVCEPLSVEFFAREHRLTAAETGVLRGLSSGKRPSQIAREAGVAMSTVRTQITSIRLKTGARSIGELLRLVTVLPPIVPVLMN